MAIHGYKVDDKKFQKEIDNALARQVTKLKNAGENAMKSLSRIAIDEFYKDGRADHHYTSIKRSLTIYSDRPKQNKDRVFIDINMEINEDQFLAETESYYNIYPWTDRHNKSHLAGAEMVIGRQWKKGIIGLPNPYQNYTTTPLKDVTEKQIKDNWSTKVNKYLR